MTRPSKPPHREIHDIADLDPEGLPSSRSLLKATGVAVLIAAVVLTVAILPAEFGIDPTGLGRAMGLTALHQADTKGTAGSAVVAPPTGAATGALAIHPTELRSDVMTLTLAPRQGAEIKAVMAQGQHFVFEWSSDGGPVYVDMHGDPPNADKDTFTSFRVDPAEARASGTFHAPFEGNHGWYWENRGDQPLTITLKTAGFYGGLFMP